MKNEGLIWVLKQSFHVYKSWNYVTADILVLPKKKIVAD